MRNIKQSELSKNFKPVSPDMGALDLSEEEIKRALVVLESVDYPGLGNVLGKLNEFTERAILNSRPKNDGMDIYRWGFRQGRLETNRIICNLKTELENIKENKKAIRKEIDSKLTGKE